MRAMASKLFSSLKGHPLITAFSLLLLFTLPIFHMLMFFWPLIVSTALGVLAVVSFGRQTNDHTMPNSGCGTAESAGCPDIIAFPAYEEKISNMLMLGNQEVTWLEWLHNIDTQKLCARECDPVMWDAHGCDISSVASDAGVDAPASSAEDKLSVYADGSTCKDEASDDASLCANDKGGLYLCDTRGERETPVSVLVSTEENETRATMITSTIMDGFRTTAIVLENLNKDETNMTAPILVTKDETNSDMPGEDRMCRYGSTGAENAIEQNGITLTGNEESDVHSSACTEGDKEQISVDEVCLTGGDGNECKTMQGLLDSPLCTKNEWNGYASAGGDKVVGIVEALVSTPSANEAISDTYKPKIALTHEQDVLDFPSASKPISPLIEVKSTDMYEMRHVDARDEEEKGSKQLVTQDPQWDVSDGEEDQSSLRFSFFHNSSFTPSLA